MTALDQLRALARHQTHGGYAWAAVMEDGELVCVRCVRAEYRQVFRSTRDKARDGWQCIGITNSGESEEAENCAHCSREMWPAD